MRPRLAGITAFLAVLLLTAGCGTLDVDLHLTFRDDGTSANLTMVGTGALGANLLTPKFKDDLAAKGWQTSLVWQGETATLKATADSIDVARRASLAVGTPGPSAAEEGFLETLSYERRNAFFTTDYTVRFKLPASDSPPPVGNEMFDQQTMMQIVNSMLRLKVSMTLPGEIVETNADNHTADTATWILDYESLMQGRDLYVTSRRINYGAIAGTAVLVVLIVAGAAWLVVRRSAT